MAECFRLLKLARLGNSVRMPIRVSKSPIKGGGKALQVIYALRFGE